MEGLIPIAIIVAIFLLFVFICSLIVNSLLYLLVEKVGLKKLPRFVKWIVFGLILVTSFVTMQMYIKRGIRARLSPQSGSEDINDQFNPEQLNKLNELKDEGKINEELFLKAKSNIEGKTP